MMTLVYGIVHAPDAEGNSVLTEKCSSADATFLGTRLRLVSERLHDIFVVVVADSIAAAPPVR